MKSKLIAIAIIVLVFVFPFRIAFLSDEIAHSVKFIFAFLGTLIGFLVAFGIGTHEPFDRKVQVKMTTHTNEKEYRKAA